MGAAFPACFRHNLLPLVLFFKASIQFVQKTFFQSSFLSLIDTGKQNRRFIHYYCWEQRPEVPEKAFRLHFNTKKVFFTRHNIIPKMWKIGLLPGRLASMGQLAPAWQLCYPPCSLIISLEFN
jgi:hypothetical protein